MAEAQIKFGYDDQIPENIREMFTVLCQNLSRLQGKWDLYKTLFDIKNSDMLNGVASYAFMLIKDSLFSEIIMGICRLGDNSIVCGQKTVGFKTLYSECSSVPDISIKLMDFKNLYTPFKTIRNKHIGHTDYDVHIGDPNYHLWISSHNLQLPQITNGMIDKILECSAEFLKTISIHYSGKDLYFHPISMHDGRALVYWLNYAFGAKKGEKV